MAVSERRVCRVLGQHRSTQRKAPRGADDEAGLTEDIIALARQYGRYDFVEGRTHDGHKFRILSIIDEVNRECLAAVEIRSIATCSTPLPVNNARATARKPLRVSSRCWTRCEGRSTGSGFAWLTP